MFQSKNDIMRHRLHPCMKSHKCPRLKTPHREKRLQPYVTNIKKGRGSAIPQVSDNLLRRYTGYMTSELYDNALYDCVQVPITVLVHSLSRLKSKRDNCAYGDAGL